MGCPLVELPTPVLLPEYIPELSPQEIRSEKVILPGEQSTRFGGQLFGNEPFHSDACINNHASHREFRSSRISSALLEKDRPARRRCHVSDSRRASSMVRVVAARTRMSLTCCCSDRPLILARSFNRFDGLLIEATHQDLRHVCFLQSLLLAKRARAQDWRRFSRMRYHRAQDPRVRRRRWGKS